jgi:hypothetical protein
MANCAACLKGIHLGVAARLATVSAIVGFVAGDGCRDVGDVVSIPREERSAIKLSDAEKS